MINNSQMWIVLGGLFGLFSFLCFCVVTFKDKLQWSFKMTNADSYDLFKSFTI